MAHHWLILKWFANLAFLGYASFAHDVLVFKSISYKLSLKIFISTFVVLTWISVRLWSIYLLVTRLSCGWKMRGLVPCLCQAIFKNILMCWCIWCVCVGMHVCMCSCVCLGMNVNTGLWRSEDNLMCLSSFSTLSEAGPVHSWTLPASDSWGWSCLSPPSSLWECWGYRWEPPCLAVCGPWGARLQSSHLGVHTSCTMLSP